MQDWRVVSGTVLSDFDGRFKLFGMVAELGDGQLFKAWDSATEENVTLLIVEPEIAADASFAIGVMGAAEDAAKPRHSAILPVDRFA